MGYIAIVIISAMISFAFGFIAAVILAASIVCDAWGRR